ncbi:hypothetical protein TNCV_4046441 [Trichonephila clavipes]|nr:hypothetical protein TNCV_4046441 [Trichonephila clavipes]
MPRELDHENDPQVRIGRDRSIGRLECELYHLEVSEELGIASHIRALKRFPDDGNVIDVFSTGHPRVTT